MFVLGLDIGTTKLCALLIDSGNGNAVDSLSAVNSAGIAGKPYESLQDADKIVKSSKTLCDGLIDKYGAENICAIGISGQMHGVLYLDKSGRCLSPLATWQDGRAASVNEGKSAVNCIFEKTGEKIPSGYGITTHYYNMLHGLVPDDASYICTVHDYAAMSLSNRSTPLMHISDSHSFGLYDSKTRSWNFESAEKLGITANILPETSAEPTILGAYRNIPVCVAIGDNQASFLGSVKTLSDTLLINVGTGAQVSLLHNGGDNCRLEIRPLSGNLSISVGSPLCGGSAYASLRDLFAGVFEMCGQNPPADLYTFMNAAGEKATNPPAVDTKFRGTRKQPELKGSIQNITPDNFLTGELVYGVLQGIATELYDLYRLSGESHTAIATVVASGNAVRRNPLLRNILGKTFNQPVTLTKHNEEAAFGAALYGATAAKIFPDVIDAAKVLL